MQSYVVGLTTPESVIVTVALPDVVENVGVDDDVVKV